MANKTVLFCVLLAGLLGCTTSQAAEPLMVIIKTVKLRPLYLQAPSSVLASACLIGTSTKCLDLAPTPFEPCLATTKKCAQKGFEAMPVARSAVLGYPAAKPR